MTPEERNMITALFDRLKSADGTPRDAEADRLIRDRLAGQPGAGYLMTQTILVQEHGLNLAQERIAELEKQLAAAKAATPAQPTSFLGGVSGGAGPWGRRQAASEAPNPSPWANQQPAYGQQTYPQQGGYAPPQPGFGQQAGAPSFMRSAMATAAGVAGGALLFQGIQGLFSHGSSPFGGLNASQPANVTEIFENTTNNYGSSNDQPSSGSSYGDADDGGTFDGGDESL